ncbi:unnamed protein product [Schistosoma margrebowiei]|uniref:Uncharacterized protein n=1 Tax=Schistosoma margrebowiei TaxID=48269 RepID=A0A183MFB2_9TREM|nr:unnamed protein product [Schistosoma margrebowiei]
MDLFLRHAAEALHSSCKSKWILVVGNEACDLDSTACALAYGFYKQMLENEFIVIPVCSINREDMVLRTEVTFWLTQCGLKWEELIYLDDVFNETYSKVNENELFLILVDHHLPTKKFNEWPTIEIIDHHQLVNTETVENCPFKQIDLVGSCATLITFEILKGMDGNYLPSNVWKLLYGAILIDTIGLSNAGQMAGRLTELDLRMANRIEDIIYNQIFTPNVSRNSLFTQLETAKFTVDGSWSPCAPLVWNQGFPTPLGGASVSTKPVKAPNVRFSSSQFRKQHPRHEKAVRLSTWDLLRRDMKIVSSPNKDAFQFVCSTVSGVDFTMLINSPDFTEAANRICAKYNANLLVCLTVGYPLSESSSIPSSELTTFRRRALILYNMNFPAGRYNDAIHFRLPKFHVLIKFLLNPKLNLDLLPQSVPDFSHFIAIVNNIKMTRKILLPLLVQFLQQLGSPSDTDTSDNNPKNDIDSNDDCNNVVMESDTNNNISSTNTKSSHSLDTTPKCSTDLKDKVRNATEFALKDVIPSLRKWLLPLNPHERCEFLRSFCQSSLKANDSPSLDLLNSLWTSIWYETRKTSKTVKSAVGTQTPTPKLLWLKSHQTRRVASVVQGNCSAIRAISGKMGGFKSARRFTLSDTNDLTLYSENISKARVDLPSSRFVHRISDEHLCVSDSENTKPSWLETEYLTRIPAWLPSTLTSTSLDSAEAVSYRLYRRLSGMPLSKDSEDEVSYGHTSFQRDNHDVHIIHDKDQDIDYNKLEDDELALLRTSLTDCRQLFIDKQTSTSNLSNYTSWLSSHPDHITEQGLKFLKLGFDLQPAKTEDTGMTLKMTKSILTNEQQSHPSFHVTFDLGCTEDSKIMISDE